jgi:hypothetical protein
MLRRRVGSVVAINNYCGVVSITSYCYLCLQRQWFFTVLRAVTIQERYNMYRRAMHVKTLRPEGKPLRLDGTAVWYLHRRSTWYRITKLLLPFKIAIPLSLQQTMLVVVISLSASVTWNILALRSSTILQRDVKGAAVLSQHSKCIAVCIVDVTLP